MARALENRHLADLHGLAAEHGIERFRLLGRDELVAALRERAPELDEGGDNGDGEVTGGARQRSRSAERRGSRRRSGARKDEDDAADAEPDEQVAGVLDITPRGHGFIRLSGLEANEGDVYVSPSQIRRCEMQRGDEVAGPARSPRRGERYRALVHVDTLNGAEPGAERTRLEEATPQPPSRRIPLVPADGASEEQAALLRAFDLLSPLARGQRVLVKAAAGAGRSTLLRGLAASLSAEDDLELVVLLIDERPEEVAAWREAAAGAEVAIATSEMRSGEQLRLVELALGRASRRAEAGSDVVLLIDSISRVAVAADDPGRVKPIFGAGRETSEEGLGSLTIIATTLGDGEDEGGVERALETTENGLFVLDRELASAGVVPAVDASASRVTGEERLRDESELAGARALRAELAGLERREAAEDLGRRIGSTADNKTLLGALGG